MAMAELKGGEIKTLQNIQYSHSNQTAVLEHAKGETVMRITDFPGHSMFWAAIV